MGSESQKSWVGVAFILESKELPAKQRNCKLHDNNVFITLLLFHSYAGDSEMFLCLEAERQSCILYQYS